MASYAFKTHQKSLTGPYMSAILDTRIRSYAISRVIIIFFIFFFFFRPAFSLLEPVDALNLSLNVSRDAGGVHRRKSIFVFLPPVATTADKKRRHFFHAVLQTAHPLPSKWWVPGWNFGKRPRDRVAASLVPRPCTKYAHA